MEARGSLDHPDLIEPQCVETQRVLRVVFAAAVIRQAPHHAEPDLEAGLVQLVREEARRALGIDRADIGGLEDRAQRALCRDRVLLREVTVSRLIGS